MDTKNAEFIKILIVDDHPIVRQGIAMLLEDEKDLVICGETGDANEAMSLVGKLNPDLVITDISLEKNANGIDLIHSLKERYPEIHSLVITMHENTIYAERAIMAGASGFIMKKEVGDDIIAAIRTVLKGDLYLQDNLSREMITKILRGAPKATKSPVDRLTNREFEVFELLGKGLGTRKIANKLNITVNTVETHRRHIRKKLHLKDSDELVMYAIQWVMKS